MNYQNLINQIVKTKQGREFFVEYVKINRKGVFVAELGNNQLVNINDLTSPNYAQEIPDEPVQEDEKPGQEEVNNDKTSETEPNV